MEESRLRGAPSVPLTQIRPLIFSSNFSLLLSRPFYRRHEPCVLKSQRAARDNHNARVQPEMKFEGQGKRSYRIYRELVRNTFRESNEQILKKIITDI